VTPVGDFAVRYALVLVIAWIGALKFTTYEANRVVPLDEQRQRRKSIRYGSGWVSLGVLFSTVPMPL